MPLSPEYYKDKANAQKIKQALAMASMRLKFPGHPRFNLEQYNAYLDLQFHMALVYFYQPDLRNAIRLVEQLRMDTLRLPGITRASAKMLPIYTLAQRIYSYDIDQYSHDSVNAGRTERMNPAQAQRNQALADRYLHLNCTIQARLGANAEVISEPDLPQLDLPVYAEPNLRTSKDKANDPSAVARAELKNKQARLFEVAAQRFLDANEDVLANIEQTKEIAEFHCEYSELFLQQPDFMNAVIHAKRAEAMLLELDMFKISNPNLLPVYRMLNNVFGHIAPRIADRDSIFAIDAAYYASMGEQQRLSSGTESPGSKRPRSVTFSAPTPLSGGGGR